MSGFAMRRNTGRLQDFASRAGLHRAVTKPEKDEFDSDSGEDDEDSSSSSAPAAPDDPPEELPAIPDSDPGLQQLLATFSRRFPVDTPTPSDDTLDDEDSDSDTPPTPEEIAKHDELMQTLSATMAMRAKEAESVPETPIVIEHGCPPDDPSFAALEAEKQAIADESIRRKEELRAKLKAEYKHRPQRPKDQRPRRIQEQVEGPEQELAALRAELKRLKMDGLKELVEQKQELKRRHHALKEANKPLSEEHATVISGLKDEIELILVHIGKEKETIEQLKAKKRSRAVPSDAKREEREKLLADVGVHNDKVLQWVKGVEADWATLLKGLKG
jgi:hypothetical protein